MYYIMCVTKSNIDYLKLLCSFPKQGTAIIPFVKCSSSININNINDVVLKSIISPLDPRPGSYS